MGVVILIFNFLGVGKFTSGAQYEKFQDFSRECH